MEIQAESHFLMALCFFQINFKAPSLLHPIRDAHSLQFFIDDLLHTAGSDTIFVQIYMDPPQGVPGVSKNQIFFFTNKTVEFLR